jgi:hypothetical protein
MEIPPVVTSSFLAPYTPTPRSHIASVKCSIFGDITLWRQLKVGRRFGGTCRPHLLPHKIELFITTAVTTPGYKTLFATVKETIAYWCRVRSRYAQSCVLGAVAAQALCVR